MEESKIKMIVYEAASIQYKIYTVRNVQVMLVEDLAAFYCVEKKQLNRAVKRNPERFPEEFMFQLTIEEWNSLRFQVGTSNEKYNLRFQNGTSKSERGGRRYLPYVFTEQGVVMVAGVLRSKTAVKMSIQIINAFVVMRKFIINNAQLFQMIDTVEKRQLKHEIRTDEKFDKVFNALQSKDLEPKQGIFYNGQIFDAHKFVSGLIRTAEKSILLIDNYIDETVLDLLLNERRMLR